jgi:hypothetical protein
MKKIIFILTAIVVFFSGAKAQINMTSNGYVGIGVLTTPHNNFDVNGNIQISNAQAPVGLMDELYNNIPLFSMSSNFREPNKNNTYLGAAFRIDGRNISGIAPIFQWLYRPSGSGSETMLMSLNSSGQLGIGRIATTSGSNMCILEINGSAYSYGGTWQGSDLRMKKNIKSLNKSILDSLLMLNAVSFQYIKPNKVLNDVAFNKTHYGYIAQDVEKIFPNIVMTNDSDGYKAINYIGLIPIIVEALKKQQKQIDSLQHLVNKKNSSSLKSAEFATTVENAGTLNQATLAQNAPNPFSIATSINYFIPETVRQASINIYDLTGVQIKSVSLISKGNGSIVINANELRPGIYIYNLITDGQEVTSKRMVLTQ